MISAKGTLERLHQGVNCNSTVRQTDGNPMNDGRLERGLCKNRVNKQRREHRGVPIGILRFFPETCPKVITRRLSFGELCMPFPGFPAFG
jgi:hypothetical protein